MRLCLKEMIPIAKKRKNGEGTLRLRKDGRWEGRIVVGYNEKSLPITKCVTAKTKTECSTKLEALKEQYGRSSDKIKPDMPFGDWIDFWYQTYCRTLSALPQEPTMKTAFTIISFPKSEKFR